MPDIFGVIADPTRRRLLAALLSAYGSGTTSGERSVGELVTALGVGQPTVSKHLRVLRDAGLVTTREDGQFRFYRLDPRPLDDVEEWLSPFTRAIESDDTATTAWTSDGRAVSVRRSGATGRSTVAVGAELGRVMAEASFRAATALSGAQTGLGRVVEPVRRRLRPRPGNDDD
jgi:ArsR family transcriptional regulator